MNKLEKYSIEEELLISRLHTLTCKEAHEECKKLWKLIPIEYEVNPVRLNRLMHDLFHKDPDYTYERKFKIPVNLVEK